MALEYRMLLELLDDPRTVCVQLISVGVVIVTYDIATPTQSINPDIRESKSMMRSRNSVVAQLPKASAMAKSS